MKSRREIEEELGAADEEEGIYSEEDREELLEEDQIDDIEDGFMMGYEEGEKLAKCALCKKVLTLDFVEEEIDGETYRFCSEDHAEKFIRKKEKEED